MNLPQPILVDIPNVEESDWFMREFFYHINFESYSHLQVIKPNCQTHSNVILLEKEKMKQLYALKNIPNDYDGWDFIREVKKYLNKEDYTFKVRGQKLMDSFKSTDPDFQYGYPIEKSKLLRAYFHKKKPIPKPETIYTFNVHVNSNVLKTDSYLVNAPSEREARALVEKGLIDIDTTFSEPFPDGDCTYEIDNLGEVK